MISLAPPLERVGLSSRRPRFGKLCRLRQSAWATSSRWTFATADNTLVQRFFARYPEPLAEGADALAQLDRGQSRCECAYAFPPKGLLAAFVAKTRSDGLRGVIAVPARRRTPLADACSGVTHDGRRAAGPMRHRA